MYRFCTCYCQEELHLVPVQVASCRPSSVDVVATLAAGGRHRCAGVVPGCGVPQACGKRGGLMHGWQEVALYEPCSKLVICTE